MLKISNPCVAAALMSLVENPLKPNRIVIASAAGPYPMAEFPQSPECLAAIADVESGNALLDWNQFQKVRSALLAFVFSASSTAL